MDIPDLTGSRCRMLVACGRLVTKDPEVTKKVRSLPPRRVANYGQRGGTVLVWGGGEGEGCDRHVHIDVVSADFKGKKVPPVNSSVSEIGSQLDAFIGLSISVRMIVLFTIPLADLPAHGLIRGTLLETTAGPMAIKQTAGEFTISRGPVERVEWLISKDANAIDVELEATKTVLFDNAYLCGLLDSANSVFDALILGKT
jgi:hypothetical protein